MRFILHLPLFLLPLVLACGSTSTPVATEAPSRPAVTRQLLLEEAVLAFFRTGSLESEAILASSGPEVIPLLRPLLKAEDPDIRWRTLGLLLDAGAPITLDTSQQVDLILFDLSRREVWAYASLRALGRLQSLGDDALPRLREVADGEGDQALTARDLLTSLGEEL